VEENRKEQILAEIREFAGKLAAREDVQQAVDASQPAWELGVWEMTLALEETLLAELPRNGVVMQAQRTSTGSFAVVE
jgi:hypothetical protein